MEDPSRPRSPQTRSTAPSPYVSRSPSAPASSQAQARPTPPQARPAPPLVEQRPAVGPTSVKTTPAPRAEAPVVQTTPIEHLTIAPQPSQGSDPGIEFDWEPAALGTNRSYACTVTTDPSHSLSVTLEQGMYRRTVDGQGVVKAPVIPPAPAGARGTLSARNLTTGASAVFTWQWQLKGALGAGAPAPPKPAGLIGRLFGRTKQTTAATAKVELRAKVAPVAERLGARAPLAASLRFFGQEAVGHRFAFILDRSGSMRGRRWDACMKQLVQTLRSLPEHTEFFVVLFASHHIEPQGQTGWMPAERSSVDAVITWLGGIWPGGGTEPASAFRRVFSLPSAPDVVYFLTDGEIEGFTASSCAELRGSAPTIINTIALESGVSADLLRETAEASGGQFILVADASNAEVNG